MASSIDAFPDAPRLSKPLRAVVVGAVDSTRATLEALAAHPDWAAAALVTLPLSLAKRHSDFVDLRPAAAAAGAGVIEAKDSNDPDVLAAVADHKPDYAFVIGWSQICKPAFRALVGDRVVGYHPAPLPMMRGRAAIPWTILLDQPITGSTLFWIDDGVDSGDILAQKYLHVARDETATSLYDRHIEALTGLLADGLDAGPGAAAAGAAAPRAPQDDRYATWTAKRTPRDGDVDWRAPAAEVARLIRAVTRPYPGAFTAFGDAKLILWSARPWPDGVRHAAMPGQLIEQNDGVLRIMCGDGAIEIDDWSIDGEAPTMRNHVVFGRHK